MFKTFLDSPSTTKLSTSTTNQQLHNFQTKPWYPLKALKLFRFATKSSISPRSGGVKKKPRNPLTSNIFPKPPSKHPNRHPDLDHQSGDRRLIGFLTCKHQKVQGRKLPYKILLADPRELRSCWWSFSMKLMSDGRTLTEKMVLNLIVRKSNGDHWQDLKGFELQPKREGGAYRRFHEGGN